jgi:hypothetical protein
MLDNRFRIVNKDNILTIQNDFLLTHTIDISYFKYSIIKNKKTIDYFLTLNNVKYIEFIEYTFYGNIWNFYFKNGILHNNELPASILVNTNFKLYYFNGIEYDYENWLYLPERVRELRDVKLKLI